MMKCRRCDHDNRPGSRFCLECGAALALACSHCGGELPSTARFCDHCGRACGPEGPNPPPSATATAFAPNPAPPTADRQTERSPRTKWAAEGERKQVTVLFADVKGSMELAEQLDPEEWSEIMQRFFRILSGGVERFEGFVDKFTGDGIMALFGAPVAHEDHAQRACHAALHLRGEIARYANELKREHGLGFSTRMGMHSGEVVVGSIRQAGADLRMDYTAQGHTVGLAQRMETLASPDSCYLTATTAALAGGYFDLEDLGEFRVKGVASSVHVHRLVGIGAARNRFDVSRSRGLSRFVGRAADLRTLDDALERSSAGKGQVVGVMAQAGTGKSRLCFEFLEGCRARGMRVVESRAVAHGRNIPFLPVVELFRGWFGIAAGEEDRVAREKIAGRMVVLDHGSTASLPLLYDFLGVGDPQRPAPALDPGARQRQLLDVMRLVSAGADDAPTTVTLIEDLHWLDAASAEFLAQMIDSLAERRHLLLVNYRPEYRADWLDKPWCRQIALMPLGVEAISELLDELLGKDPGLAPLHGLIHAKTGGNPFFTEEVAQMLLESGRLVGSRGAYRLAAPIERLDVPPTVQALLAARIDRLAERDKQLLQTASVIGKNFPLSLLEAVSDLTDVELGESLAVLQAGEFLNEHAQAPVAVYAFKHPLTQEVALGSQLRERRRQVHASVAQAIEQQCGDHLDENAALLAHHWEEAGDALRAAQWHRRAVEWPGCPDFATAVQHWTRIRELLAAMPVSGDVAELRIAACSQLLGLSWRVGGVLGDSRTFLDEGQAIADTIGDRHAHLMLSMAYGVSLLAAGGEAEALEQVGAIQREADELGDAEFERRAWGMHFYILCILGRFREALPMLEQRLANLFDFPAPTRIGIGSVNAAATFALYQGHCLVWSGRIPDGIEALAQCRQLAEESGEIAGYTFGYLAEVHYLAGDADRALASAGKAAEVSRKLGDPPNMIARVHFAFAYAHLAAGRADDAVDAASTAVSIARRSAPMHVGQAAALLAEALLQSGDLPAAEAAAEEAISICRRSLRANYETMSHGVLARAVLRRCGAAARARVEASLADAADVLERSGSATLAPALLEWRAELACVLGNRTTRDTLLGGARDGYGHIGAPLQAARLAKLLSS